MTPDTMRALVAGLDLDHLSYDEHVRNGAHSVAFLWLPKSRPEETNLLAHLLPQWSFEPTYKRYPAEILILRGFGAFVVNGVEVLYHPGLFLRIAKDSVHGFGTVDEDTLFVKSVNYMALSARFLH